MVPRKARKKEPAHIDEKRRLQSTIATHLKRRLAEPLNQKTVLAETKRLFKKYPCKYEYDKPWKIPIEAKEEMGQFLIIKGAQKAGFSRKEISALMEIMDPRKQAGPAEIERVAKILEKMPKGFAEKILSTRLFSNVIYNLKISDFRKEKNGDELYHIAKFGATRAFQTFEILTCLVEEAAKKRK